MKLDRIFKGLATIAVVMVLTIIFALTVPADSEARWEWQYSPATVYDLNWNYVMSATWGWEGEIMPTFLTGGGNWSLCNAQYPDTCVGGSWDVWWWYPSFWYFSYRFFSYNEQVGSWTLPHVFPEANPCPIFYGVYYVCM